MGATEVDGASGNEIALAATGIAGFDEVLFGGLPRLAVHLVEGEPGTGKTTFGLQFLRKRPGEAVLRPGCEGEELVL